MRFIIAAHPNFTECIDLKPHASLDVTHLRAAFITRLPMIHEHLHDHIHHIFESKLIDAQVNIDAAPSLTYNPRWLVLEPMHVTLANRANIEIGVVWIVIHLG